MLRSGDKVSLSQDHVHFSPGVQDRNKTNVVMVDILRNKETSAAHFYTFTFNSLLSHWPAFPAFGTVQWKYGANA